MHPWMGSGLFRAGAALAALLLVFGSVAAEEGGGSRVLAESDFLWDVDGWTLHGNDAGLHHGSKMIKAADNDTSIWYYVAPAKFLGSKRAAYGGKLSFRHGFYEYNRSNPPEHPQGIHLSSPAELLRLHREVGPDASSVRLSQRRARLSGEGLRRAAQVGGQRSGDCAEGRHPRVVVPQRPRGFFLPQLPLLPDRAVPL